MSDEHTILPLGGTGRTGRRVLDQLLGRGVNVRAIVRSASRLPEGAAGNPRLTVIVADLLTLNDDELLRHAAGCDAVVSCLGAQALASRRIFLSVLSELRHPPGTNSKPPLSLKARTMRIAWRRTGCCGQHGRNVGGGAG